MNPVEEIVALADAHQALGLAALDRGEREGRDATAEALEHADIARIMRHGAQALATMSGPVQQDYAHRLKCALWQRLDDSPVSARVDDEPA